MYRTMSGTNGLHTHPSPATTPDRGAKRRLLDRHKNVIPDWVALVREKVEGLRFGVVQLVIHEGRVTQIERTEKTRLTVIREQAAE